MIFLILVLLYILNPRWFKLFYECLLLTLVVVQIIVVTCMYVVLYWIDRCIRVIVHYCVALYLFILIFEYVFGNTVGG
jgi:hypothetical protein